MAHLPSHTNGHPRFYCLPHPLFSRTCLNAVFGWAPEDPLDGFLRLNWLGSYTFGRKLLLADPGREFRKRLFFFYILPVPASGPRSLDPSVENGTLFPFHESMGVCVEIGPESAMKEWVSAIEVDLEASLNESQLLPAGSNRKPLGVCVPY